MTNIRIIRLQHEVVPGSFDCGVTSINNQIENSYYPSMLQYQYSFEILGNDIPIGFYVCSFRKIPIDAGPKDIAEYSVDTIKAYYSLDITYFAIARQYQNYGIGSMVLDMLIKQTMQNCSIYPIRLITLDALKEKVEWYKKRGFRLFKENDVLDTNTSTVTMYVDCLLSENRRQLDEYTNRQ